MKEFDVIVVGTGPSGAMTAYYIAEKGIKTALLDKKTLPRYKTCGGGLVYRGRQHLPFDVSSVVEREFYSVDIILSNKLRFKTHRDIPIISMVMREDFDYFLTQKAVAKKAELIENFNVIDVDNHADYVLVKSKNETLKSKILVIADGALSPISKLAGWSKDTRQRFPALEYEVSVAKNDFDRLSQTVRFDMDAMPGGYGWCFPKKELLSVGLGTLKPKQYALKTYLKSYFKELGLKTVTNQSSHGFVIPISPRTDGFVKNRAFLVGDAAGFADPVTAEGLSNAILSGQLIAQAIIDSDCNEKTAEKLYNQSLEKKLLPELKTGQFLSQFVYHKIPLRNLLLKKYGQRAAEEMTNIFTSQRSYPKDIKKKLQSKLLNLK